MNRSSFLFAQPSFFEGMSRMLDFLCTLPEYNYSSSNENADGIALTNDWLAIYDDFESAFRIIAKRELNEQQKQALESHTI